MESGVGKQKNKIALSIIFGFVVAFLALGLPMIGITVNLWLGSGFLLLAIGFLAFGFLQWEKVSGWPEWARTSSVWVIVLTLGGLFAFQVCKQYQKDHSSQGVNNTPPPPILPTQQTSPAAKLPENTDRPTAGIADHPTQTNNREKPKPPLPRNNPPVPSSPADSVIQNNSGGVNVQQGTTGDNSPITNSPITLGDFPADARHLSSDQEKKIAAVMKAETGHTFRVVAIGPEAQVYAREVAQAIRAGGWVEMSSINVGYGGDGFEYPISVFSMGGETELTKLAQTAFSSAGISMPYRHAYAGPASEGFPDIIINLRPQPNVSRQTR